MIAPHHVDMLAASGITTEHAEARGYETITEKRRLADLKITPAGRIVPGLLVPMLRIDGSTWGYQYRPDAPRLRDHKPVKYETPYQQTNGLDIPPGVADQLGNPDVPLFIAEGVKKADCGALHGLCIVGLCGVWNWLHTNSAGGKLALPEWRDIALNNRRVVLAFDGDVARKESVQKAARGLAGYLATKGAKVEYLHLPDTDDKTGLDDYLAEHTVDALMRLVKPTAPTPKASRPESAATPPEPKPEPAKPVSLEDALAVFKRWLHMDDVTAVLVVAAAVVDNLVDGDPVWLLLVGPPSGGKTEILSSLLPLSYIVPTATITEAALLSGTSKRERAQHATGGLLRQIGDFGILLAKDFTSVLSQNRDTAKQAMAALREVYDGRWDRPVGTDGGQVLHWLGKCGFIGGVTPSYDRYGSIVNALGDRYLLLRLPNVDPIKQAQAALKQSKHEKQMRAELAQAMTGLIAGADRSRVHAPLDDDETAALVVLASFAARARTAVERDGYSGELLVLPQPEGPARLIKAMCRLYGGLGALGVDDTTRWKALAKIALDCAPAVRVPLMDQLLDYTDLLGNAEPARTAAIAAEVGMVTKTASRILDDLALLGIAERTKKTDADNSPDLWAASGWLQKHWPKPLAEKVGQKSTTRRVGVVKEDIAAEEQTPPHDSSNTAPRTFQSHNGADVASAEGSAEEHTGARVNFAPPLWETMLDVLDPKSETPDDAYRNGLCIDCRACPPSAGRPRCDGCHATYVGVMAGYDS